MGGSRTDPNMPKKPMTGYFTFCAEHRDRIKEEMRLTGGKVAPKLAEMWKQLPEEKQQEYKDNYNLAMEKYRKDLAAYKETDEYKKWQKQEAEDDDGDEFVPESEEEIDEDEYIIEEIEDDEEEEEEERRQFEGESEEEEDEGLDWDELEKQTRKEEAAERRRKREEKKRRREEEGEYSGAYMQNTTYYSRPQEDQWHISQELEHEDEVPAQYARVGIPRYGVPLQKRPRLD